MGSMADLALILVVASMVALLAVGVTRSARLGGRDAPSATRLGLVVAGSLALWLAITALLASSGVLSVWTARPPRWPLLPLGGIVGAVLLARTRGARALGASAPSAWPIAAQTFRVAVELVIFALHEDGRAPVQATFEGRNVDILVGLTAPVIAWLVVRRRASPALVVAWNVLGLAILANTVGTIATSTPGPLHLDWPGEPFTALVTWPVIWLPSFLVPVAVFLHVVSLGQKQAT